MTIDLLSIDLNDMERDADGIPTEPELRNVGRWWLLQRTVDPATGVKKLRESDVHALAILLKNMHVSAAAMMMRQGT